MIIAGCSTEKNTAVSRAYHQLTSRYNIYFNGYDSYNRGIKKAERSYRDDFTGLLAVFPAGEESMAGSISPEMERAIKKASKVVSVHSITAKPERKNRELTEKEKAFYNRNEYNNMVYEAYLLMGKSQFHKQDLFLAERTCRHIIQNYHDEKVKTEARVWLARTYTALKDYREAQKVFSVLEAERTMSGKLRKMMMAAWADFHIRQDNYELAIPRLEEALSLARRKKDRTRYLFILAQLYEKQGDEVSATGRYRKLIKMNPPYEMTFNAKINLAGTFDVENRDSREIRKELRKMLRDEKNKDFKDQIYFAFGRLAYREGKIDEAIEMYQKSAGSSVSNTAQKAVSYLAIADIYFARVQYREAQMFYDSAVTFLNREYPGYTEIASKSGNLSHLVRHIQTVEREDSLQYVASLSENERNAFIDRLIQKVREEEQRERQLQLEQQRDNMMYYQNQARFRDDFTEEGKWYFYNPTAVGFGQTEFKRKWGDRRLEDHWRRVNKSVAAFDALTVDDVDNNGQAANGTATAVKDNKSREFYMEGLPLNDSLMQISHALIRDALYGQGVAYRDLFRDRPKAIEAMEELNRRYNPQPYQLESYYDLHNMHREMGNDVMSGYYKNQIISTFPDSEYALILSDPEYLIRQTEKRNRIEQEYQNTYSLYLKGQYPEVIVLADQFAGQYQDHPILPKFYYLRALSIGQREGFMALKNELDMLIQKFPGHEVTEHAAEVIALIRDENPEIREQEEQQLAGEIYRYNQAERHFLAIAVNPSFVNLRQLTFNIINYNIEYHINNNYDVLEETLTGNERIISIRDFPDRASCEVYRSQLIISAGVFEGIPVNAEQILPVSAVNYATLMKDKSLSTYLKFYKKEYLSE